MGSFKLTNYIVLIGIVLLSYACAPTKRILVEFPQSPTKEITQDVQSLLLVNRTTDDSYSDSQTDSLQKIFYENNFKLDTIINDLTAVDTTLIALGDLLFESGRFDYVIPEDRYLDANKNAFFSALMEWDQVAELCERYNTDAILSMDMYKTRIVTQLEEESLFDSNLGSFISVAGAKMAVIYEALFRIYDPQQEVILATEVFQDTLLWEDYSTDLRALFSGFTPVKQALTEAGIALALDLSEKISTGWRSEYRVIFSKGSPELKNAAAHTDSGDWTQAIEIWESISRNSKSKSEKSKALFNLATACEIRGDINCALNYALESYNTSYHPLTYQYLELLERKKKGQ
ncbi:MAG TPA: DUF6340 family protein [Draconibacterium sp.]|nr:DUF6340 family protein [Draconibacterium sp.]